MLIAARSSPLSKAQAEELQKLLPYPFTFKFVETYGDRDKKTSLRTLGKTDFFTREIDSLVLNGTCRAGLHSAKDLPEPIPEGLRIAALTHGVSSKDALVFKDALPDQPFIATSSERREEAVRAVHPNARFCDIRGTIAERLQQLEEGQVHGVVIAEAALLRLGLTHLKYEILPGETTRFQGQLAITVREDDWEAMELFAPLDSRTTLYTGLDLPVGKIEWVHIPQITVDYIESEINYAAFTHVILTSKTAAKKVAPFLTDQIVITVGKKTASFVKADYIAEIETAEGVVDVLKTLDLKKAKVLWPRSAKARAVISDYLNSEGVSLTEVELYDVRPHPFLPELPQIEEVIFTSPSTVDAYLNKYPLPSRYQVIGPVTHGHLRESLASYKIKKKEHSHGTTI